MRKLRDFIFFTLILAIFIALFGVPIWRVTQAAFLGLPVENQTPQFTLGYFTAIFADPMLRAGLFNSVMIALLTTVLCVLIAMPLAILANRYDFLGKSLFSGLVLVPLILPPFVGAIGMRQLLGRNGAFTAILQNVGWISPGEPFDWLHFRLLGIVLVQALGLYPILYLNLTAALANIDPAMQHAAANLGASRWTIFRRITLPLMRPGLFAGGTLVLIWSFTELGTPLMFDFYITTPVQVYKKLGQVTANPIPYALVVLMMAGSILLYVCGKVLLGRSQDTAVSKASIQSATTRLGFIKSIPVIVIFTLIACLAMLPHVSVVLMSLCAPGTWYESALPKVFTRQHYLNALTHPLAVPSVRNSVMFASLSTIVDILLGLWIAAMIVRSKLPRIFRAALDSLAMLPLAVPGTVMAFGYLAVSLQIKAYLSSRNMPSLAGLFDVQNNPTLVLVVAYAMRRLPYVVRSAVAGLQQTPEDLELASRNLGASPMLTLRRITVPLIAANLIAGALLAFAFAMLEVSDSLILAQKEQYWPITKAIYELFQRIGDGPFIASALGVWAMLILTLTILSTNALLGRKMGAIFRV
ncbi:MAG TPA: iron ABC transporter permease [Tepidisphaeraceae bacterium]|nr:iron ABC transporter permease [Tepidisphaeraceae bacterium]